MTSHYKHIRDFEFGRRNYPDLLRFMYYRCENLFPADLIARLFGQRIDMFRRSIDPTFRELALRISNLQRRYEAFSRYATVSDDYYLRRQLGSIQDLPVDVFIGAGYSFKPDKYKELRRSKNTVPKEILQSNPFRAIHHEFVLDLDLTDYDSIRTCCKGRDICQKCWRFMVVACEMIEHILRHDFGVKHRLWLFSGGRGMHCWCFDRTMMATTKPTRALLIRYIQKSISPQARGDTEEAMFKQLRQPSTVVCYNIALKHIDAILKEQNCLATVGGRKMLDDYMEYHISDEKYYRDRCVFNRIKSVLDEKILYGRTSSFNVSERIYKLLFENSGNSMNVAMMLQRVVMFVTCPRIDDPVSRDLSHLLRCPLSVHTKANNRLVVPFRPEHVAQMRVEANTAARLRTDLYRSIDDLGMFETEMAANMVGWRAILEEVCVGLESEPDNWFGSPPGN